MISIYALTDPRDGALRYVGKTMNPLWRRLSEHVTCAKRGKPKGPKRDWILDLVALGLKPRIKLLETCEQAQWRERELHWASMFPSLLNAKKAGAGGDGQRLTQAQVASVFDRLGVIADAVLAAEIGVTRKAVSYYRDQYSIPASFDRTRNAPPPPMGGHNKLDLTEFLPRLGREPDYLVAKDAKCCKSVIARRRRSLGIPAYATVTGNDGRIKVGEPHRRWASTPSST